MKTLLAVHEVERDLDNIKPFIALAQEANAHLNIVALGVIKLMPAAAGPGIPVYYYDAENNELLKAGKERVNEIEALVQKENLSATVTLECRDPALIEQTLMRHAMFADATVFPNQTVLDTDFMSRAFNGALLNSGTPAIILGAGANKLPDVKKVMYAWNDEPEAAKAVHQSLAWVEGAKEAHVVVVDPDEYVQGPNPGDDIAAFLARQDLAVSVDRLPGGRRDIADVLLEHATDIKADLLVMGGYSHSRLREWLLGGTTRDILQKATIPVLMAH